MLNIRRLLRSGENDDEHIVKRLGLQPFEHFEPIPAGHHEIQQEQIRQRVIDIVCEHLAVNKDQVTDNTSFIEDIGADSLDIVELVMELEEEFDIQIPDEQAEKIKTVGEAVEYIKVAVKNKGADGGAKA